MSYLITALDLIFLSWFFWLPLVIVPIACYYTIMHDLDSRYHKWSSWPFAFLAMLGGGVLYRYPGARLTDWHSWLYAGLIYVAVGFGVALYKWIAVLVEFRKGDVAGAIAKARQRVTEDAGGRYAPDLLLSKVVDRLESDYAQCVVESTPDGFIVIWPDWRQHPIGTWATYWFYFVLSIPFDWLTRVIEWVTNLLKDFWNGVARRFSVRG